MQQPNMFALICMKFEFLIFRLLVVCIKFRISSSRHFAVSKKFRFLPVGGMCEFLGWFGFPCFGGLPKHNCNSAT